MKLHLSWTTSVFGLTLQTWIVIVFGLVVSFRLKLNLDCMKKEIDILTDSCLDFAESLRYLNSKLTVRQDLPPRPYRPGYENEAGPAHDLQDDLVVIYNRVPKTGSTTFAGLAYDLCKVNKFHVLYMNVTTPKKILGLDDQFRLITNMTSWTERKPAIYHGHIPFMDFSRFGFKQQPVYINMLREPLDRLVSFYYFLRWGDDFRPFMIRARAGDNRTFDDCVAMDGADCNLDKLWLQIPYFCGHHPACRQAGNEWALQEAKRNLFRHYLVVGVTEEMESFISVLEAVLPRFYRGASALYRQGLNTNLRKTSQKIAPTAETLEKLKTSKIYRMERNFYDFALNNFRFARNAIFNKSEGDSFLYQNIKPQYI